MTRWSLLSLAVALLVTGSAGCGGAGEEAAGAAEAGADAISGANLTIEGVSLTSGCGFTGCSVVFHNNVCNRGTAPAYGSVVGGRWGGPGSISSSCSGIWDAIDTLSTLNPGSCRDVIVYGPGYVGSQVNHGTQLSYKGMVDVYCQLAEPNETDNTQSAVLVVP